MMIKEKKVDVSVVITAHNEGILAHKTMLSVLRAVSQLEESNVSYEILVHIDNGTPDTKRYFERYKKEDKVSILYNEFGDLSKSRNFTIQQAKGEYIALADADDLYSENWLIDFYLCVKGKKNVVARFNYVVTFGGHHTIVTDCTDVTEQDEFLYSFDSNIYGSPCMFHKSIYQETSQRENNRPFGYEDWQWFLDTKAKGVKHQIVPGTVLFYRRDPLAKTSLLAGQLKYRAVLSKTDYFSFSRLKSILKKWSLTELKQRLTSKESKEKLTVKYLVKKSVYNTLLFANKFTVYKVIRRAIRGGDREQTVYIPEVPESLMKSWRSINSIEKSIYPDNWILRWTEFYKPNKRIAIGYLSVIDNLRKQPDTIVFLPWLNPGGADKVFINTLNEIAKQHSDWSIAVMQTERSESTWKDRLSKSIGFVNLDREFINIDYERQMDILAMFIVQNDVKRIIIANSMFGYYFALRYKALIQEMDIKLYVYSFNGVVSEYGRVGGFAHENLPLIYDVVYKVVTDNSAISRSMIQEHGYLEDKYCVHHQFIQEKIIPPKNGGDKDSLRILWAGRVAYQKMPEVLAGINQRIDSKHTIDIYGRLEEKYDEAFLTENRLNYKREFNGIDDLPTADYDVFLYTSNADGMPNMLLEAAAKGLPIIAPNVGGIGDFVRDGKTGLLIDDCQDVDAYVTAINKLRDGKLRHRLATNAQDLLAKEFTIEQWRRGVTEIFDR